MKKGNADLKSHVDSLTEELSQLKLCMEKNKKRIVHAKTDILRRCDEKVKLIEVISSLKAEVKKGVEDVAKGLEAGYLQCYDRAIAAGVNMADHSFEAFWAELAKSMVGTFEVGDATN